MSLRSSVRSAASTTTHSSRIRTITAGGDQVLRSKAVFFSKRAARKWMRTSVCFQFAGRTTRLPAAGKVELGTRTPTCRDETFDLVLKVRVRMSHRTSRLQAPNTRIVMDEVRTARAVGLAMEIASCSSMLSRSGRN